MFHSSTMHRDYYSSLISFLLLLVMPDCIIRIRFPQEENSSTALGVGASSNLPEFQMRYNLDENRPAGEFIADLPGDALQSWKKDNTNSDDKVRLIFQSQRLLTYRLGTENNIFAVDEHTGTLQVHTSPDLEALCALPSSDCSSEGFLQLSVQVNVWDDGPRGTGTLVAVFHVLVRILDVNDNPPQFAESELVLALREVIFRKYRLIDLPRAEDKDVSAEFHKVNYRLDEEEHSPNPETGATFQLLVSVDERPQLRLLEDLDYERVSNYTLVLKAWNPNPPSASSKWTARLTVKIVVLDMNDNEPVFENRENQVKVSEETPVNTVIYQMHAVDKDATSVLKYSLLSPIPSSHSLFSVSPEGEVSVRRSLNYESQRQHDLSIHVTDGEFHATSRLLVQVTDTNDEAPQFHWNPQKLTMVEEKEPGALVGQVTVTDRDSPEVNGGLRCFEPSTELESALISSFPSSQQPIRFQLLSATMMMENSMNNSTSSVYSATRGPQPILKFDLSTRLKIDRENVFATVDPKWVIQQSNERGDYTHLYVTSVLVCHDGVGVTEMSSSRTSTLTLTVSLLDVNDNTPQCARPSQQVEVTENGRVGEPVLKVEAYDSDEGENARLAFQFGDNSSPYFQVDTSTGWITTIASLDREAIATHQLKVLVSDSGKPKAKTSLPCMITVIVTDQNDHTPRLISSTQLTIMENQPPYSWVAQLMSHDEDVGPNADVTFTLVERNPFFLLYNNGTLVTKVLLDRENRSQHCLPVEVKNAFGDIPLSSSTTVCVNLLDENDNCPRFDVSEKPPSSDMNITQSTVSLRMSVVEKKGFQLLQVRAVDPDESANGLVRYSLIVGREEEQHSSKSSLGQSGNSLFTIDQTSGQIVLLRSMNVLSDLGLYVMQVIAADGGIPALSGTLTLRISIENIPSRTHSKVNCNNSTTCLSTYSFAPSVLGVGNNLILLILLASVTFLLVSCLITAIVCVVNPGNCCLSKNSRSTFVPSTTQQQEDSAPYFYASTSSPCNGASYGPLLQSCSQTHQQPLSSNIGTFPAATNWHTYSSRYSGRDVLQSTNVGPSTSEYLQVMQPFDIYANYQQPPSQSHHQHQFLLLDSDTDSRHLSATGNAHDSSCGNGEDPLGQLAMLNYQATIAATCHNSQMVPWNLPLRDDDSGLFIPLDTGPNSLKEITSAQLPQQQFMAYRVQSDWTPSSTATNEPSQTIFTDRSRNVTATDGQQAEGRVVMARTHSPDKHMIQPV